MFYEKYFDNRRKICEILIFSLQSRDDRNCLAKNLKRFIIPFRVIWRPTRGYARSARRRRTSDESLADFQSRLQTVILLNSHLNLVGARALSTSYHNARLNCNFKSEQVIQRNKLQQKHLPMPTLVNCSPARDWVISIHFKFYRLRDVRSFVDKCLTGTPGTPLKVFS